MNWFCKIAAIAGCIGFACSWLAVAFAAQAKREYFRARRKHCKWCGLSEDGGFEG